MAPLRVIQWATGSIGREALRALIRDPDLELVGVYVHSSEKVGRDAGELAGLDARTGILATDDAKALLPLGADCVVYTAIGETRVRETVAELSAILRSGKNVVSSALMNLIYPPHASPKLTEPLAAACRDGRSTLFTNGIDPGFSGDLMPLAALHVCERVDRVRVQELFEYGTHPDPAWAAPFGFGREPQAPAPILAPGVPTLFWGGMVRMLARALRVELDELREHTERWVADESFSTPMLTVEKGTVAAIRFEVQGIVAGRPAISAEHVTRMRREAAPDWPRPPEGRPSVHRTVIEGQPSLTLDLAFEGNRGDRNFGGITATALRIVNAIPAVVAAPPGLVSTLDLPLPPGRRLMMRSQ